MKLIFWCLAMAVSAPLLSRAGPADVAFSQSGQSVEAYDFVEVTLNVSNSRDSTPAARTISKSNEYTLNRVSS